MISGYTLNNSDALFGSWAHQPCSPRGVGSSAKGNTGQQPAPPARRAERLHGAFGESSNVRARRTRIKVEGRRGPNGLQTTHRNLGLGSQHMDPVPHLQQPSARLSEKERQLYLINVVEAENNRRGPEAWSTTSSAAQQHASTFAQRPKSSGRTLVNPPMDPDGNSVPAGNGEWAMGSGYVGNNTPRTEYIQHHLQQ